MKYLYTTIFVLGGLIAYWFFDKNQKEKELAILKQALEAEAELQGDELESKLIGVKPTPYKEVTEDAIAIEDAINQFYLPFDDTDSIVEILRDKSYGQLAALDEEFEKQFGEKLLEYLKEELSETDFNRINAIIK